MCITGSKPSDNAGTTWSYKRHTFEHTPKIEEFQKKGTDSEKMGRIWRSFEAKHKPARRKEPLALDIRHIVALW